MNMFLVADKLEKSGEIFAMVTIINAKGSTPRRTGKMIVKSNGDIIGTIGGGLVEAYVIDEALQAINAKQSKVIDYILNSEIEGAVHMHCGGNVSFFVEVVIPKPRILILGAGHVAKAVANLASFLEYNTIVIDDRPEHANKENFPHSGEVICSNILEALKEVKIDENTFVVIVSKDSELEILKEVINTESKYIGIIGSKRKSAKILSEMKLENNEILKKVYTPIGLDIGGETPKEVAISIFSEIMKVKNNCSGNHLRREKDGI